MSIGDRPCFPYVFTAPDPGESFQDEPGGVFVHEGMTYRQWLAGKVMAASINYDITDGDRPSFAFIATVAVNAADALIDALDLEEDEGEPDELESEGDSDG